MILKKEAPAASKKEKTYKINFLKVRLLHWFFHNAAPVHKCTKCKGVTAHG